MTQAQDDYATHPARTPTGRSAQAEPAMNADMPRGHYLVAQRQYSCRSAFVRTLDPASDDVPRSFSSDHENTIVAAMIVSRLPRDATIRSGSRRASSTARHPRAGDPGLRRRVRRQALAARRTATG
jgi:hypothetical protein